MLKTPIPPKYGVLLIALFLGACGQAPQKSGSWHTHSSNHANKQSSTDGPPDDDLDVTDIPNATPKLEPISRFGNPSAYEVWGNRYHVMPHSKGYSAKGTASWYGKKFHGLRTSSGEPYDMYGMTAAHKSLPLPTYCKVKNLHNGKEIIVKVNDRGPFVEDRLIDLSYAAAKKLGIHGHGTGKVEITAIDPVKWHKEIKAQEKATKLATTERAKAKAAETTLAHKSKASTKTTQAKRELAVAEKSLLAKNTHKQIYLQLGTFKHKSNADKLAVKAELMTQAATDIKAVNKASKNKAYRVRVGPLANESEAQALQKKLASLHSLNPKLIYE